MSDRNPRIAPERRDRTRSRDAKRATIARRAARAAKRTAGGAR